MKHKVIPFRKNEKNYLEINRKDIFKIMNNNIIELSKFDKKIFKQLSSNYKKYLPKKEVK